MNRVLYITFILLLIISLVGCGAIEKTDNPVPDGFEKYVDINGWSILYPATWDKVEDTFIQETSSGQTIQFSSEIIIKEDLLTWINSEISRKLSAEEVNNTIFEPLKVENIDNLELFQYTIQSDMDGITHLLRTSIYYDGNMRYAFMGALPIINGETFEAIINSFKLEK